MTLACSAAEKPIIFPAEVHYSTKQKHKVLSDQNIKLASTCSKQISLHE